MAPNARRQHSSRHPAHLMVIIRGRRIIAGAIPAPSQEFGHESPSFDAHYHPCCQRCETRIATERLGLP